MEATSRGTAVVVEQSAAAETRVIHGMTLWESADAMERSEPVVRGIREAETRARHVIAQETATFLITAFHLARS